MPRWITNPLTSRRVDMHACEMVEGVGMWYGVRQSRLHPWFLVNLATGDTTTLTENEGAARDVLRRDCVNRLLESCRDAEVLVFGLGESWGDACRAARDEAVAHWGTHAVAAAEAQARFEGFARATIDEAWAAVHRDWSNGPDENVVRVSELVRGYALRD